ncbi:MAG: response regulator, partial [bacterium]
MKKQIGNHRTIIYGGSGERQAGRESSPPSDPCLATKEKGDGSEKETFRVDRIEETRPASGKGKILVMDDQEIIGKAALLMLEYLEYEASFVKDGHEAVKFYIRAKESGQPFDAVILDLTVPGGMSGEEAVQEL